jgi:hypothetical protein
VNLTISADVVAWYAAIVGTGSLAVSIYNAWLDRPRVVVRVRAGYRVEGAPAVYPADKLYIAITVANRGRRPVTIAKAWLEPRDRKAYKMLINDSLLKGAREVAEGKAIDYLLEQTAVTLAEIKAAVVEDLTGRIWRGKIKE